MNISINPLLTTNFNGGFDVQSYGLVQGVAMDDPAIRYALASGIVASTETLPMWGGVGIYEDVPSGAAGQPSGVLGGNIGRATSLANLTGFSVFNQAHAMINTPQSPVPLAATGATVNLYRLGSGARVAVACDPALVNLDTGLITQQVSWDFGGQRLVPYVATYPAATPNSYTSYTSATGILVLGFASAPGPVAGSDIVLSGMTPTSLNGNWNVVSTASAGTVLNIQVTPGLGAISPGSGQLNAGGGALACKILRVQAGNSKTVVYDPVSGFATWNQSGAAALILI